MERLPITDEEFADLLASALLDDDGAMERLLLDNFDYLSRFVTAKIPAACRSQLDADDVLQETFTRAFVKLSTFGGSTPAHFRHWLKTIAKRVLQDAVKAMDRKKRRAQTSDDIQDPLANMVELLSDTASSPSSKAARTEAIHALQEAMLALPEDQREIVRLLFIERLSAEEISIRVGRTDNAVRAVGHRALSKLQELMGNSSLYFTKK